MRTPKQWEHRRAEIKALLMTHIFGSPPPAQLTPVPTHAVLVANFSDAARGYRDELWNVTYDCRPAVTLTVEVMVPTAAAAAGPLPLFVTENTHRSWAMRALERGYAALITPTNDVDDMGVAFRTAFPDANWGDIIRRAWVVSRCVDWVLSPDLSPAAACLQGAGSLVFTGHSRNGKQAELVGALDERFGAIVGSSPSTPTSVSWRFASGFLFGPAPGHDPSSWYRDDGRYAQCYEGFEDRNPIDAHGVLALIAPRPLLMAAAMNDLCTTVFGVEQSYKAALPAYQLLGAEQHFRTSIRPDKHVGWIQVERYLDFFDIALNRSTTLELERSFPQKMLYNFSWETWNRSLSEEARIRARSPPARSEPATARVLWGLGVAPLAGPVFSPGYGGQNPKQPQDALVGGNGATGPIDYKFDGSGYVDSGILHHGEQGHAVPAHISRQLVSFGSYYAANLFFPANLTDSQKLGLPAVLFLHPYNYNEGFYYDTYYAGSTYRIYEVIAAAGYLVFAFDQLGMGSRVYETVNVVGQGQDRGTSSAWYDRPSHSEWSQLGKMVHDVSAAVDFLTAPSGKRGHPFHSGNWSFPNVLPGRIYAVGYGLGGAVGLHAAALDQRIAGVASVCGFGSLRRATEGARGGGLRRDFELHQLQPRLGFFAAAPADLPYDYDELLELIVSRPATGPRRKVLVLSPQDDRINNVTDVTRLVRSLPSSIRESINLSTPVGINRLDDNKQQAVIDWLHATEAAAKRERTRAEAGDGS